MILKAIKLQAKDILNYVKYRKLLNDFSKIKYSKDRKVKIKNYLNSLNNKRIKKYNGLRK